MFLSLTGDATIPDRIERGRLMTVTHTLSDSRVMVTRCVRRSLRNPEAFFTALMLPIVLMLLFVYVFGGDLSDGWQVRQLRRPRPDRAVRRLRCRYHGRRRGDGHDQRHRRPDPLNAGVRLVAPRRSRRGQPGPQPGCHRPGDRRRPRSRLAADWVAAQMGGRRRDDRAVRRSPSPGWPPGSASWLAAPRRRPPSPWC